MDSVEAIALRALAVGLTDAPTDYVDQGVAMAVASHEEWRAVFVLTLQPNSDWWTDLPLFHADTAGALDPLSQGGGYGTGWKGLYAIAPDHFQGSALITLGSAGRAASDRRSRRDRRTRTSRLRSHVPKHYRGAGTYASALPARPFDEQ
jgi:hypothetical protein